MALRKICVNEITSVNVSQSQNITCCPTCSMVDATIVDVGDACEAYLIGTPTLSPDLSQLSFTFRSNFKLIVEDQFGTITDNCWTITNETLPVPGNATICCGQSPLISSSIVCSPAYTFTDTCVTGTITKSFTIDNLCIPTIICVDDTTCPI